MKRSDITSFFFLTPFWSFRVGSLRLGGINLLRVCVYICVLFLSGRSVFPLPHHSLELTLALSASLLSLSWPYPPLPPFQPPNRVPIGCSGRLHSEGLFREQRLNLGAGIFPLASV